MTIKLKQVFATVCKSCVLFAGLLVPVSSATAFELNLNYAQDPGPVSWTGFIFNPSISYDTFEFKGSGGRRLDDAEGFRVGAEIGFDKQIGSVVVGVAGDVFKSWAEGDRGPFEAEVDVHGTIRGRLGYSFGRLMAYGTGGFAFARLRVTDESIGSTDVETLGGWVGGGGLEYVYNKSFTIRAEYLHTSYDDAKYSSLPAGGRDIEMSQDQISVGFVSRF